MDFLRLCLSYFDYYYARLDAGVPQWLVGDKLRVRQILVNLLGNAAKFTEAGHIRLLVDSVTEDDGFYLRIKVEDTGIGIKKEDLSKLFVSFSQISTYENHNKEGTGLGLAISRELSRMMGGDILVESEFGKGSTFTVTLRQRPVSDKDSISLQALPIEFNAPEQKNYARHTVFVVDDNALNLKVATALLESFGLKADCAKSGSDAVQKIRQQDYDVVFMDHMMPFNDFLAKPIDMAKLSQLLSKYME